ncbi:hypothetical protein [Labilibaculum sp.]|uniref:hypothetical protein n=1 Tax=Labilibaculum sp. TaxID=2060723 RepID=UPI003563377D
MINMLAILRINIVIFLLTISIVGKAQSSILHKADSGFFYAVDPSAEVSNNTVYVYCFKNVEDAVSYKIMQDYIVLESSDMKT